MGKSYNVLAAAFIIFPPFFKQGWIDNFQGPFQINGLRGVQENFLILL